MRVLIRGRVQGVGFRVSAASRARALGLAGWVRNRPDGAVEAVFEGPSERVASMVAWCRHGPAGAEVAGIDVEDEPPTGEKSFQID